LAQLSGTDEKRMKEWFRITRKKLGYGQLARSLCDGNLRALKEYLRQVLVNPNASETVPEHIRSSILDFRRRAHQQLLPHASLTDNEPPSCPSRSQILDTSLEKIGNQNGHAHTRCRVTALNGHVYHGPLDVSSTSEPSSSRDSSISLDFVDPLTPGTISPTFISKKRKRDESPNFREQKVRKLSQEREQPHPHSAVNVLAPIVPFDASEVVDSGLPDDFLGLFNPQTFQDCDASWLQAVDFENLMPTTCGDSDPLDPSLFVKDFDSGQWNDCFTLGFGIPFLTPQSDGLFETGVHLDEGVQQPIASQPPNIRPCEFPNLAGEGAISDGESDIIRELRLQISQKDVLIQQLRGQLPQTLVAPYS